MSAVAPSAEPIEPPAPGPCRLVVGIGVEGEPPVRLFHRLDMEFGPALERFSEPSGPAVRWHWQLHADWVGPHRLAPVQAHLHRVEAMEANAGGARLALRLALVTPERVTMATQPTAPGAVYIDRGIWGEVALHWSIGAWKRVSASTPSSWLEESGRVFWMRVRERALETPTPGAG